MIKVCDALWKYLQPIEIPNPTGEQLKISKLNGNLNIAWPQLMGNLCKLKHLIIQVHRLPTTKNIFYFNPSISGCKLQVYYARHWI